MLANVLVIFVSFNLSLSLLLCIIIIFILSLYVQDARVNIVVNIVEEALPESRTLLLEDLFALFFCFPRILSFLRLSIALRLRLTS